MDEGQERKFNRLAKGGQRSKSVQRSSRGSPNASRRIGARIQSRKGGKRVSLKKKRKGYFVSCEDKKHRVYNSRRSFKDKNIRVRNEMKRKRRIPR